MKWIFLLLLVTNIAILLRGWQQGAAPAGRQPEVEAGMGNLRLLSRPGEPMPAALPPPFPDEAEPGMEPDFDLLPEPETTPPAFAEADSSVPAEADIATGAPAAEGSPVGVGISVPGSSMDAPAEDAGLEGDAAAGPDPTAEQLTPPASEPPQPVEVVPEPPPVVVKAPEPVVVEVCGSIGPMDDGARAETIVQELEQAGMESSLQQENYQKTTGFWVIIPPFPSRQQAIEMVDRLKRQGVKDTGRFFKGEYRNGVSLGIFSRRKNAEKRRDLIAAKGFEPQVIPRIRDFTAYRIDYRASGSESAQALQQFISRYPKLEQQTNDCPGEGEIEPEAVPPDQP